ncbi:hypothetical protein CLD20_05760 [Afifella sp. IM 167]|nr:hypothetical protein [Afifella sp. IM 167]
MASRIRKRAKRLGRDEGGSTALEFAMIAPILFLLIMGVIEIGMLLTARGILEHATYVATRLGRTGFVESKSTRDATIRKELRDRAALFLDPSKVHISSVAYTGFDKIGDPEPFTDANGNGARDNGENFTDVNGNGKWDADQGANGYGGAKEIVVYDVTYPWTFFTPIVGRFFPQGGLTLEAHAIVKNEPY